MAAAQAWNALPQHIRNAPSLPVFRRTEDRSVSFVVLGCYLTISCALSVRPSFTADVYWLSQTVLTVFIVHFYGGPAANTAIVPP